MPAKLVTRSQNSQVFYSLGLPAQLNTNNLVEQIVLPIIQEPEMADDRAFLPNAFHGSPEEDATVWIRQFLLYTEYKGLIGDKPVQLFKVLLQGPSGQWLDSLAADKKDSLATLQASFMERYQTPDIVKYRSARDIFSRKQQVGETVDDFICSMLRLSRIINLDERAIMYSILNGLRKEIQAYVTQNKPGNVQQLTELARVAELTCPAATEANGDGIQSQLTDVQTELKRLSTKLDLSTAAAVSMQRSTTPEGRRVSFDTSRREPSPTRPQYQQYRSTSDDVQSRMAREMSPRRDQQQFHTRPVNASRQDSESAPGCQRCGSRYCRNPLYCRFINLTCRYCNRVGHAQSVCRQRIRDQNRQH